MLFSNENFQKQNLDDFLYLRDFQPFNMEPTVIFWNKKDHSIV